MNEIAITLGSVAILLVLWDAFETIVVPKTVQRRLRVSTIYSNLIWKLWHSLIDRMREGGFRQALLVSFGPSALIFLFAVWAGVLVMAFGAVHWGIGALGESAPLGDYLYYSGVTFFTLGFGDLTPLTPSDKFVAVLEAGTGFGFLAVVIAFIPILYQAFQRRERLIVLMDSRAGSEPTAGELIRRHVEAGALPALTSFLKEAENWAAEQLENYLSYPILAYYRSQHDNQSWLKTSTAIMDACALLLSGTPDIELWQRELRFQARSTFAMLRHVIVDLAYVLGDPPADYAPGRMGTLDREQLGELMAKIGGDQDLCVEKLDSMRGQYEPYLVGLARDLHFTLPAWVALPGAEDNWQLSAWDGDGHFS